MKSDKSRYFNAPTIVMQFVIKEAKKNAIRLTLLYVRRHDWMVCIDVNYHLSEKAGLGFRIDMNGITHWQDGASLYVQHHCAWSTEEGNTRSIQLMLRCFL